jgi:SM-20-related protein
LQNKFETLINSFIDDKVGIAENFLSISLAAGLKENLLRLYADDQLHAAGTGNVHIDHTKLLRTDHIHWLDRKNEDLSENAFFDLIDKFVAHLNRTCYTGINEYEFHYTLYPVGSYYKKHLDQFQNNDTRKYSMIMYLNDGWEQADGGELCIYHLKSEQFISPQNGKIVFFGSSELEHEVLITNKARLSITGWLKKV